MKKFPIALSGTLLLFFVSCITVIAMCDLANCIDSKEVPGDPFGSNCVHIKNHVVELKCEYTKNPIGIDAIQPRFSWIIKSISRGQIQTAYQVLVASSEENLTAGIGDKWDSGKLDSDQSVNVVYQGKALESGEKCWWKVRVWDGDGKVSPYSKSSTFEMGLLEKGDWKGAWISSDEAISAPLLRKEFAVEKKIDRAMVYISGLGNYELFVNGQRVGDHVLDPATTYYNNDQPFDLGSRVLYATYDVTEYLKSGQNAVGVMLGNGWYSAEDDIAPAPSGFEPYGDRPILIMQMNLESGDGKVMHVVSDRTWKTSSGPVTYNDYCQGESYDARLEKPGWNTPGYDDSDWKQAHSVRAPGGKLLSQMLPPIKVIKTIKPVAVLNPEEGVYVFDFGQIISGWTRLHVEGPAGTSITIRHATSVYEDGSLDARSSLFNMPETEEEYLQGIGLDKRWHHHVARQTDTYIMKGQGEEIWEPEFTLHGFRYAEVTGYPGTPPPESLEGRFARNAVETTGKFSCSNELLNQIHQNVFWSFMNSLQGMLISGMDRSERAAWTGDPSFVVEDYIYNLNTAMFWAKWIDDIKDSQKPDGSIPVVTPLHWRRTFDAYDGYFVDWSSVYPALVWNVYWYYNDQRILQEHYDGLKKLVDLYVSRAEDHIISTGISDHMEPQPDGTSWGTSLHTPHPLTSTAYHYYNTWILARTASVLGKTEDARHYTGLTEAIKDAFNREFLDETTNQYGSGSQASNAMPLYLRLVPEGREQAVLNNLVDEIMINHNGHLSTGIMGTNALEQVLGEYGRADVMYEIATRTTFPSWGEQVMKGATTLWEAWEGDRDPDPQLSYDMYMFGSTEKFFYKDLAGIAPAAPGYKRITIKPRIVDDLNYAKASVKTVRGRAGVDWKKDDDAFDMRVTIPVNSKARVSVPRLGFEDVVITESGDRIWENHKFIQGIPGITAGADDGDYVVFDVGSGSYNFQLTNKCTNAGSVDQKLLPVPDKLVVLTHDDRSNSWIQFVAPLLKEYGFGATFFVTEGLAYKKNEDYWITWDELKQIHDMGFEIGNHTATHPHMSGLSKEENMTEVKSLELSCQEHGIPKPVSLGYPAFQNSLIAVEALEEMGYLFARRGPSPEYPTSHRDSIFRGPLYDPQMDHPLLIPSSFVWESEFSADSPSDFSGTGAGGHTATLQDFVEAVKLARDGKIVVLCFHGVPDYYPHASTKPEDYAKCMKYLHDEGYKVIALRDLVKYVDPYNRPDDPYEPIRRRMEHTESNASDEY